MSKAEDVDVQPLVAVVLLTFVAGLLCSGIGADLGYGQACADACAPAVVADSSREDRTCRCAAVPGMLNQGWAP